MNQRRTFHRPHFVVVTRSGGPPDRDVVGEDLVESRFVATLDGGEQIVGHCG